MGKRVFISHASEDEQIVSLFVDNILVAGCGVMIEDIIYTSREDTGVINGEDIPEAIKDGIRDGVLFFMMASEAYRKSEVCLNEMGAAWINDRLCKKIILLPGIDFDQIGWLMNLKKGTKILDAEGLDAIHDQVGDILSTRSRTATWNRSRDAFLRKVKELSSTGDDSALPTIIVGDVEDEDYLDYREKFDHHSNEYIRILKVISSAMESYTAQVGVESEKLNDASKGTVPPSISRVRSIMTLLAKETDTLSTVYENNTRPMKDHFDKSMEYATRLQQSLLGEDEIKRNNRDAVKDMTDNMILAKDSLNRMYDSINSVPDIDKTFRKSKNRLLKALDGVLTTMKYCIKRANEFQIV